MSKSINPHLGCHNQYHLSLVFDSLRDSTYSGLFLLSERYDIYTSVKIHAWRFAAKPPTVKFELSIVKLCSLTLSRAVTSRGLHSGAIAKGLRPADGGVMAALEKPPVNRPGQWLVCGSGQGAGPGRTPVVYIGGG